MIKNAYIKKIDKNTWKVLSEKGKNLGEFHSLESAKKRLRQIEYFKHKNDINYSITFSSLMRNINKYKPEEVKNFMENFYKIFNNSLIEGIEQDQLEDSCLMQIMANGQQDEIT